MKKALLALVIIALVLPVFADDALVMPARVIRTYLVGAYADISSAYDSNGDKQDMVAYASASGAGPGPITAYNLGAAVEYGVTDWVTAAVQWAPGYTAKSDIDWVATGTPNLASPADLFVGAKFQIVGPKAPVQSDGLRFAIAPGIKIPLAKVDWEAQYTAFTGNKDFLLSPADKPTLGVGGRAYFDLVLGKMFFLNLYSQFIYYPTAVDLKDAGLAEYGNWHLLHDTYGQTAYNPTLSYGYDLTCEFEPHFSTMLGEGIQLSAGVPVTYTMSPAVEVGGDTTLAGPFAAYLYEGAAASNLLTVGPNASVFFMKAFLPLELKVGYTLPLMGENSKAANTLTAQLKVYAKF